MRNGVQEYGSRRFGYYGGSSGLIASTLKCRKNRCVVAIPRSSVDQNMWKSRFSRFSSEPVTPRVHRGVLGLGKGRKDSVILVHVVVVVDKQPREICLKLQSPIAGCGLPVASETRFMSTDVQAEAWRRDIIRRYGYQVLQIMEYK